MVRRVCILVTSLLASREDDVILQMLKSYIATFYPFIVTFNVVEHPGDEFPLSPTLETPSVNAKEMPSRASTISPLL